MQNDPNGSVLEIRDPQIDAVAVIQSVKEGVRRRRAAGVYGPDPSVLGPESLRSSLFLETEPPDVFYDVQAVHQMLAEMTNRVRLNELTFTSSVPVLGRLVAAMRNAWSWMAARWIGQHLVTQQTDFNASAASLASELVRGQDVQLWRLRQLQKQVGDLEARLAALEESTVEPPATEETL